MRGLRRQEDSRFERFFKLVQAEAEKQGCVFFLDCGEGRDIETDTLSGEDLSGWLISSTEAGQFEQAFLEGGNLETWDACIVFAIWHVEPSGVTIHFQKF